MYNFSTGRDAPTVVVQVDYIFITGRDGKYIFARRDGTIHLFLKGTGWYIYFSRRDGTVYIIIHDGTGGYIKLFTTGRDGT